MKTNNKNISVNAQSYTFPHPMPLNILKTQKTVRISLNPKGKKQI